MTARRLFEYLLIELNKVEAPTILLEDFNYFGTKAIIDYVNTKYNFYDMNQQISDDLNVLREPAVLSDLKRNIDLLQGDTYSTILPSDYFHLLSCIVEFKGAVNTRCKTSTSNHYYGAKRLSGGMLANILNNYYLKPSYKHPYYRISGSEASATSAELIVRDAGGVSKQIEILYGKDSSKFSIENIHIEYLKVPLRINLTQDEIDSDIDTSQELEFPEYVCMEILKGLVKLLMENASDPRLQTNIPVNQTIMNPGQPQQGGRGR